MKINRTFLSKNKTKRYFLFALLASVLALPLFFALFFMFSSSYEATNTIYSKKVGGTNIQVIAKVSFDNYCRVEKIVITYPNNKKEVKVPSKRFDEHCLNGTGLAGSEYIKSGDYNGDSKEDFMIISGHDTDGSPTYTTYIATDNGYTES